MPVTITFTAVELCTYNGDISRPWFIYFDVTDQSIGITVRKQFRGGINYFDNLKERLKAGNELQKYWEERLKHGWSPFLHSGGNSLSKMKFNEALDWAFSKCGTASKTKRDYSGTVRFFKNAAIKLGLDNALITGITKQHILLMLDSIKSDRKWSNHAYNKNTVYISGVLSRLIEYEVINHNPAHKIKRLPVAETDMYETMTDEEKIIIRDHLTKVHPSYFTFLMLVYHTGIRLKECLALRIFDINLDKQYIKIKPDIEEENSKTKSIRIVPLNGHILELLRLHLDGFDNPNYYIFGSPGKGINAQRKDYFLPFLTHIKRDTSTKLWKKLIWDGLKIHKYQYAMKHTGADDKILAGISLDALKTMYGHSSIFMTEKYAKKIKGVYMEQIIINSPDF